LVDIFNLLLFSFSFLEDEVIILDNNIKLLFCELSFLSLFIWLLFLLLFFSNDIDCDMFSFKAFFSYKDIF